VSGSGPGGRVLSADLSSAQPRSTGGAGAAAGDDFVDIPLSNMRKTIAKRLTEAKSSIPHYYLTSELHIDKLIA
jgi:pyruvate dehydrogenase E2 component (dihydrolipoamide acetyltransferase)